MRAAVLAHSGEAKASREAFQSLTSYEQDALIEFLKTLQVLPPGTKDRIVYERFQATEWPPLISQRTGDDTRSIRSSHRSGPECHESRVRFITSECPLGKRAGISRRPWRTWRICTPGFAMRYKITYSPTG